MGLAAACAPVLRPLSATARSARSRTTAGGLLALGRGFLELQRMQATLGADRGPAGPRGAERRAREARRREADLCRWVPGPVLERLARGLEPETGEREASVLFVDLRGYTHYAEHHRPGEIFQMLNRYTGRVSEIVRDHGGSLVDFHGDGLMAVFGVPQALPRKERAAVRAANAIVSAIDAGGEDLSLRDDGGPAVGVGIATGPVFVGNLCAVDRLIWSATGDTTNVAARLQGMTDALHAPILVDAATWTRAAVPCVARFPNVPIRGRTRRVDVYAIATRARPTGRKHPPGWPRPDASGPGARRRSAATEARPPGNPSWCS